MVASGYAFGMIPGLSGLVPSDDDDDAPPALSNENPCAGCGVFVAIPKTEHFVTRCGPQCLPAPPHGVLKTTHGSFKDRHL